MANALGVLGAIAAAVCYGVASILQSVAARRAASSARLDPRLLIRLASQAPYVAGLGLDLLGFLASVAALRTLPLFFVESAVASSVGVTALLAVLTLGVRLSMPERLALGSLGAGLLLLAVSAQPQASSQLPPLGEWIVLAGVIPVLAVGVLAARAPADAAVASAAGLAVGAGLGFGGVGVAARALVVPGSWWRIVESPLAWALACYGVLAILLFASALQRGAVTTATAITFAIETVVPAAIGLAWLGDAARPGFGPAAGLGFALTLASAIALARYTEPLPPALR